MNPINAGTSARAEYDKRYARHQEVVRRRRPYVRAFATVAALSGAWLLLSNQAFGPMTQIYGWILVMFAFITGAGSFITPNHVTAWSTGADGEAKTAAVLAPLEEEGFRVLHDRRLIGTRRANIDHVVIGPPGVYAIETKSAQGTLRLRDGEIFVQGRRKTAWLDEVRHEAEAVVSALGNDLVVRGLSVKPIICVHRAELPLFESRITDIQILDGRDLVRLLRKSKPVLSAEDVTFLADLADACLKPALTVPLTATEPTRPVRAPG